MVASSDTRTLVNLLKHEIENDSDRLGDAKLGDIVALMILEKAQGRFKTLQELVEYLSK